MEDDWVSLNWQNVFQDWFYDDSRGVSLRDRDGEYSAWRILQGLSEQQSSSPAKSGESPSSASEDESERPNDVESSIQHSGAQ